MQYPRDLGATETWVTRLLKEELEARGICREAIGIQALGLAESLFARSYPTTDENRRGRILAQEAAGIARLCLPALLAPTDACLPCSGLADHCTNTCECSGTGWAGGLVPRWELPSATIRGLGFPAALRKAHDRWGEIVPVRVESLRRLVEFLDSGRPVGQIVTDGCTYIVLKPVRSPGGYHG